jgi:hypothetical protein
VRLRYHFATWLTVIAARRGLQTAKPLSPSITGPSSVVIVELFTSEGCSSCPPADSLLRQVHLKETSVGQLIVGISEHVTYWNNLGWKDPYSSQVFTDRQNVYASRLSPEGPYTPQMVVNGREQFVGSDGGMLQHALGDATHEGTLTCAFSLQPRVLLHWTSGSLSRVVLEGVGHRCSASGRCRSIQCVARGK